MADNPIEKLSEEFGKQNIQKDFLEKRKVFLWGAVTDESAKEIISKLIWLGDQDAKAPIFLYINSPGGVISSGMAIIDTMNMIKSPVYTICMGLAASMGALILACGAKGNRFVWPHGKVMIHQPLISGQIIAPAIDIKIQANEIKRTKSELNSILAKTCSQPLKKIEDDTDRDFYMNSKEALDYGIIDKISKSII